MKVSLAAAIAVLLLAGVLSALFPIGPPESGEDPPAAPGTALRPGQTEVAGVVTLFKADHAVPDQSVPVPLTISRGQATITDALVGGKRSTIVWDGGRPLALSGQGQLHIVGAAVEVDAGGVRWTLDGADTGLEDGRYRISTPVAVGTTGLAQPRDRVDFESDSQTRLTWRGGAVLTAPLTPLKLTGPGLVRVEGRLTARTAEDDSPVPAEQLTFQGPYEVTLAPGVDGLRVMGLFQRG